MSWGGKGWKSLLYPTGRYFNSSTNRRSKRNSKEILILWSTAASTSPWRALFPSRQDVIVPPTDLIWPIPPHSRQAQSPRSREQEKKKLVKALRRDFCSLIVGVIRSFYEQRNRCTDFVFGRLRPGNQAGPVSLGVIFSRLSGRAWGQRRDSFAWQAKEYTRTTLLVGWNRITGAERIIGRTT